MIVIAHRGASAYFKENTLKAFKENYTDPVIKRYPNTPISIYQTNNL